jgi:hypothetical protein
MRANALLYGINAMPLDGVLDALLTAVSLPIRLKKLLHASFLNVSMPWRWIMVSMSCWPLSLPIRLKKLLPANALTASRCRSGAG